MHDPDARARLHQRRLANGNHWLYVTLKGPDWDRTGIGSSLYATLTTARRKK